MQDLDYPDGFNDGRAGRTSTMRNASHMQGFRSGDHARWVDSLDDRDREHHIAEAVRLFRPGGFPVCRCADTPSGVSA